MFVFFAKKGHKIDWQDIIELRPVIGIEASEVKEIIGKELKNEVRSGEPAQYTDFS